MPEGNTYQAPVGPPVGPPVGHPAHNHPDWQNVPLHPNHYFWQDPAWEDLELGPLLLGHEPGNPPQVNGHPPGPGHPPGGNR